MEPCRWIFSAPTTIRKSPPISSPNDNSGTFKMRCKKTIACGRILADRNHATTAKPTICISRRSTLATLSSYSCAPISLMENPTTSRASNSAMITVVKISRPMGSLKCPLSASTFATSPRLDSDRMPARASASVKSRLRAKLISKKLDVRTRAMSSEMSTDTVAATKNRPRIVATKLGMSISSRPTRKKKTKIPMPKKV